MIVLIKQNKTLLIIFNQISRAKLFTLHLTWIEKVLWCSLLLTLIDYKGNYNLNLNVPLLYSPTLDLCMQYISGEKASMVTIAPKQKERCRQSQNKNYSVSNTLW